MPEDRLEQLLNEMRDESVPAEEVAAAKARVWQKLAAAAPDVCSEFGPDLESYAAGRLEGSRRLLLEDHLSRCPACRRALVGSQDVPQTLPAPVVQRRILPVWTRWALAAGLAAAALYVGRDRIDTVLAPSGPRATVVSVRGALYRLPEGIGAGAALHEGEVVRTGMGARAMLRLRDGSSVEMNERTELSVQAAWSGQSIRLERGDVIVQAAKQRRGYLRVVTRDSVASVKGTIFAVSAGFAGSMVSVVQGSVQVREPDGEHLLARGQQSASTRVLQGVPVRRSFAWSENAEKYNALLGELAQIETAIATAAAGSPRTQSKLLPYLPSGAGVYIAVPNPGPIVQQATGLIEQRSQESSVLREWWNSADRQGLKLLLDRAQALAPMVGDEIVLVVSRDMTRPPEQTPAVFAEVQPGRQANVQQALEQLLAGTHMVAHVSDKLLVVSDSQAHLNSVLGRLGQGATSPFAAEIASHYQNGVSLLVGYDATVVYRAVSDTDAAAFLGADKLKYVVFEQRSGEASGEVQASLTFNGPRSGVASWLASPGVASSAEYVSTSAVGALSICTRNPRQSFNELVALVSRFNPKFQQELQNIEARVGLRIADDVIAAFGTDFTVALEKLTIPQPGWVAAVEVYQPASLDLAVRSFVEAANREADPGGRDPLFVVEQQQVDGRIWMVLRQPKMNVSFYWTYDRGYMVLSQDRDLAAQAIATRASGFPLVHSEQFRAQLPASSGLYQSGFVWVNTQGALADLAAVLGGGSLSAMIGRDPILVVVNGETERIHVASRTRFMSMLLTTMMAGGPHQMGRGTNGPKIASR